jgi:hypothetical protein
MSKLQHHGHQLFGAPNAATRFYGADEFSGDASTGALSSRPRRVYACVDTSSPRTLTISSAQIASATDADVWVFTVKDETDAANANNITLDTVGAETIDGAASVAITTDSGSVTLYTRGGNLFSV